MPGNDRIKVIYDYTSRISNPLSENTLILMLAEMKLIEVHNVPEDITYN